jgi:mannose-6-phosphate isomerase
MSTPLYPLRTERRIVEPIWGGTRLADWLNLPEPRPERIGETWQVYDDNKIINGALAGMTLAEATAHYGAALIGTRTIARYGADFPLLAKFLDAAQPLSIQVHPNDDYAHTHESATGFHGKTEAWYILNATSGASVLYGLKAPISKREFADAIATDTVEPLFHRLQVQAGDVVFVPAGTLHAIDAGITLFEIQQKSDLTYRVYDYGRRDARTGQLRELHIEKALAVSDLTPSPHQTIPPVPLDKQRTLLVACSYFALEQWKMTTAASATTSADSFEILTFTAGTGVLKWEAGEVQCRQGDSVVLPASLGNYTLSPDGEALDLLRVFVPDLEADYGVPLRARGLDIQETVIGIG